MTDGTPVQKPKRLKGPSPQLAPLSTSSRVMEFVEPEEVVRQREAEEQNRKKRILMTPYYIGHLRRAEELESSSPSPKAETPEPSELEPDAKRPKLFHTATIPEEEIRSNKLSIEEIKALPHQENYSAGSPSRTLFIKNIHKKAGEKDLVALFSRFEVPEEKNTYRFLNGRMRGQAFVTFGTVEKATEALDLANGYKLHYKPLVIQFGHQK